VNLRAGEVYRVNDDLGAFVSHLYVDAVVTVNPYEVKVHAHLAGQSTRFLTVVEVRELLGKRPVLLRSPG